MATSQKKPSVEGKEPDKPQPTNVKSCFVIMPIADMEGYDTGHFKRVYEHLIRPACQAAGYETHRADYVASSNYIIIDILKKIVESDIVVCDLSGRNPNVLYELGVRQAFNLPTILIKDIKTTRIFDIQGLRTTEYNHTLRIDEVQNDISSITLAITETTAAPNDVNSMIQLLGIEAAKLPREIEVSRDTGVILTALQELSSRLRLLEPTDKSGLMQRSNKIFKSGEHIVNGEYAITGQKLFLNGKYIGKLVQANNMGIFVEDPASGTTLLYTGNTPSAQSITTKVPEDYEITASDL